MDAAPAAMPPKPNIAATIATTKKPNDHLIIKKFLYRFKLLFLIIQYKIYATYHNNSFNAWKRNFRVHLTTVRETPVTVWHTFLSFLHISFDVFIHVLNNIITIALFNVMKNRQAYWLTCVAVG